MPHFELDVEYGQVAVFDGRLQTPFNNWSKRHVAQGFSWRPGSVSFGTLIHAGTARVEVVSRKSLRLKADTARAIGVPFTVSEKMPVEIGSIMTAAGSHLIDLPVAEYQLCYETGLHRDECWIRFTFVPMENAGWEILVQDDELDTTEPLLRTAEPA